MYEQTKDAINKLKQAGFRRSEFSVKSATYDSRWNVTGAGLPRIIMYAPLERLYELLPETIDQRLTVRLQYDTSKAIIGYDIRWEHYGHDPHLLIEPHSRFVVDEAECIYCCKRATIWDGMEAKIPYCKSCYERHIPQRYWDEKVEIGRPDHD